MPQLVDVIAPLVQWPDRPVRWLAVLAVAMEGARMSPAADVHGDAFRPASGRYYPAARSRPHRSAAHHFRAPHSRPRFRRGRSVHARRHDHCKSRASRSAREPRRRPRRNGRNVDGESAPRQPPHHRAQRTGALKAQCPPGKRRRARAPAASSDRRTRPANSRPAQKIPLAAPREVSSPGPEARGRA